MSKTILSLDQSSKITGYAVFTDGELKVCDKFSFDDDNIDIRLLKIKNKLLELLQLYNPDEVIYEDIQQQNNVANNVQTFKILAEVYGVISMTLAEAGVKHSSVLASSWKSTLGIKGKQRAEQKRNAQKYILDHYGLKVTQDEADAACIGAHHIAKSANDWTE